MAKADQIKALIRSHAEGDDSRFYSIAMQVAAQAARSGHGRIAQELRDVVDRAKAQTTKTKEARALVRPLAQPTGELAGLLTASYPKTRLVRMSLDSELQKRLERVVREQHQRKRLQEHGFSPMRKILLVGPPGTGKTMTASALAGELGIPLFRVQLDSLITKFMGETAAKLRLIFDAIGTNRGVYLFDEFDALGSQRDNSNDIGEIRRVLNSFLQFIECDTSDSLIVGATNHKKMLDRALFRRFDSVLEYKLPTEKIALHVMEDRLGLLDTSNVDLTIAAQTSLGLSHAEIAQACDQAAKDAILDGSTTICNARFIDALEERRRAHIDC